MDLNRKKYDPNVDYQQQMNDAAEKGDFLSAAGYEQQRNEKIAGEGLDYTPTQKYQPYQQAYQQRQQAYQQLNDRKPFSYSAEDDPLYRQYQQMYMSQGAKAMEDTVGKSAAMTGGYGNSYAQTAGQAVYNDYAGRAADKIPELYQLAYGMYADEGNRLQNAYDRANAQEQMEYNRLYADRDRGYQIGIDQRNWDYQMQQDAQNRSDKEADRTYNMAITLLQGGQMPGQDMLAAAGISPEVARQLYKISTGIDYADDSGSNGNGGNGGTYTRGDYVVTDGRKPASGSENVKMYSNGMTQDQIYEAAIEAVANNPGILLDIDGYMKSNGITGNTADEFKKAAYMAASGGKSSQSGNPWKWYGEWNRR